MLNVQEQKPQLEMHDSFVGFFFVCVCVCVIFVSHSFVFVISTVVCFVLIRSKSVQLVECSGTKTLAQNALQFCKKQQFLLVCVCHQ